MLSNHKRLPLLVLFTLISQHCHAQTVSQDEVKRRIAFAKEHFTTRSTPATTRSIRGSRTDRGRAYIVFGPPDQIRNIDPLPDSEGVSWEEWTYRAIPGIGRDVCIVFTDDELNNGYKMGKQPCRGRFDTRLSEQRYGLIKERLQKADTDAKSK